MTEDPPQTRPRPARRGPRKPRKATRERLENVALAYLGRFAATAHSLEKVLMRRVHLSARHHGTDPQEGAALVAAIVQRYQGAGLVDDAAFAEARARTLFARGMAQRTIALRLRQKGVGRADIDAALAKLAEDAGLDADGDARRLDREAARAYARRRRLGPWRTTPREDARERDKAALSRERDMAALARAGFSYSVAREVIENGDGAEDD